MTRVMNTCYSKWLLSCIKSEQTNHLMQLITQQKKNLRPGAVIGASSFCISGQKWKQYDCSLCAVTGQAVTICCGKRKRKKKFPNHDHITDQRMGRAHCNATDIPWLIHLTVTLQKTSAQELLAGHKRSNYGLRQGWWIKAKGTSQT